MTTCDREIPPQHWNGDAKRNLKERVYSNRCYIWKQFWVCFFFWLFCFVFIEHTFFLSQQKLIFDSLTAFNMIHFIYKIVHNIYLTSIALETRICTVKQPTTANRKGWHKQYVHFSFHFFLGLNYRYSAHLCVLLDPGQNSLTVSKKRVLDSKFIPHKSSWGSWIYCRWSKLCKRTQSQAKCSLTCQTGHMRRASRRQNFFLFQSNSALGR